MYLFLVKFYFKFWIKLLTVVVTVVVVLWQKLLGIYVTPILGIIRLLTEYQKH
jgi:hypothetical protein